jgi:arachidonate 15-lipoxygenase
MSQIPTMPTPPATLPADDRSPSARAAALEAARVAYPFSWDVYPGLAMAGSHPKEDAAPPGWSQIVDEALKAVVQNDLRADDSRGSAKALGARASELWGAARELLHGEVHEAFNDIAGLLLGGDLQGQALSVDDYNVFFRTLPLPEAAKQQDDLSFSRRWLMGSNPESLQRVSELDGSFPLTQAHMPAGDTLEAVLAEGRLYTVDYSMLDGLPPNLLRERPIHAAPARGMLVRERTSKIPRLCAIQLAPTPGPSAPIFTPRDGWGWRIARTHLAVADTICGALWFHHARTHLVAEPMLVAAHRSLAPSHPLMILLRQHALGTLYINEVGSHSVFAPHGLLDWFVGLSRDGVRELARRSVYSFRFDESYLPRRLEARGVLDPELAFPFRDDALLVWGALRRWISAYLAVYYPTDAAVAGDVELTSWVLAASAPDGGGIRGLGGPPRTREALGELVTQLVFAGSALHAAMNFPVAEELTVIPSSPFGAWEPPPTRTEGWTERDLLRMLPPLDAAQRQFDTALLLGMSRVGRLGDYPADAFGDPRVAPLLERFRRDLGAVEQTIGQRNTTRPPYVHMLPSRIPPGINI